MEEIEIRITLTNSPILKRTEFGFSNVSQILSANAFSRHFFFTRLFYSEIEIRITSIYDKHL